jgi:hypothetical protein
MAAYYSSQGDVKPHHRRSQTPFPSSNTHSRFSSPYASTPRTTPDSPSSLKNLMATHLFPTLLKQNPDRPLIINLGTLNLSDASSSSDDASFTTTTTAASLSGAGARYTYRDPPSARSSNYYYRPSSYSASFTRRERPETYVQYTRPSARSSTSPVMATSRGSGGGGPYLSPASSRGTDSRESSTSYYREGKPGDYHYSGRGGYGRPEGRLGEREYCGGCCKFEVVDGTGLCEECVFFVPNTAGRGRRDVAGGARVGFEGVRYVGSERREGRRKRAGVLGREAGWERKKSYAGSAYYGGVDE